MSKEYGSLREKIKAGEVRLEITDNLSRNADYEKSISAKDSLTLVGDSREQYEELVQEYIGIVNRINDIIEKENAGELSKIEEMWEIGKVLIQSEDRDYPNLQILGSIFSDKNGYSSDSLSVHKKIYEAFPNKSFSEKHGQTEIREFIMQPTDNERGRRGYDRYKSKGYRWPKPVRRSWCVTDENAYAEDETIQRFANTMLEKYESSRKTKPSRKTLASYLSEMTDISDTTDKISTEKALNYL